MPHISENRRRFTISVTHAEMRLLRLLVDLGLAHHNIAADDPLATALTKARLDADFERSLSAIDRRALTVWNGNPLRRIDSVRTSFTEDNLRLPQAANDERARRAAQARGG